MPFSFLMNAQLASNYKGSHPTLVYLHCFLMAYMLFVFLYFCISVCWPYNPPLKHHNFYNFFLFLA